MSIGAPSNLGTLLIQRLDAVLGTTLGQQANLVTGARPSAVTQPGNPENPNPLQNPTQRHPREAVDAAGAQGRGQAAVGKSAGATALDDRMGRAATYNTATSSAPTTLGFAARIILALLAQYPQANPAVQGRAPLLGAPLPRPAAPPPGAAGMPAPQGAGAPSAPPAATASGAGGPFAAWAALATALDQPGALSARLAQSLSQAVQGSGMFYESHLAALAFGKANPRDLAREPQARLGPHTPGGGGAGTGANTPAGTGGSGAPAPATPSGLPPGAPGLAADAGNAAGQTAQSNQAGAASGGQAGAPSTPAPPIPGLDPQAHLLVRQQLEVLANQTFAWQGEAWPGAEMDWEIQRRPQDDGDDTGTEHWSTRLKLSLPALGEVHARLTLAGDQLVMRLAAPDSAPRLDGAIEQLRSRLLAHGLQASQIAVVEREDIHDEGPRTAAHDGHDQVHPA